jgi:ribosomal protein S18 acetylase RimI-like enzyme
LELTSVNLKIVPYKETYRDAVVALWQKCGLIHPPNDPIKDIAEKMRFQPNLFFVALVDGKVVGSVMVGYEGHRGWLNYLAVAPECQRRGYGRKLVEKAIAELAKIGCQKLNLQVRKGNASAVEFYKHVGFKEDECLSFGKRLQ